MTPGLLLRWLVRFLGIISISSALVSFTARHKQIPKVVAATLGPFGNLLVPHTLRFPLCLNPLPAVYVDPVSPSGATPDLIHHPGRAASQVLSSIKVPGQVQPHGGNWVTCTIYAGTQGKRVICTLYADTQVSVVIGSPAQYTQAPKANGSSARYTQTPRFPLVDGAPTQQASTVHPVPRHITAHPVPRHFMVHPVPRHVTVHPVPRLVTVRHGSSSVPVSLVLSSVTVLLQHSGGYLLPTRWSIRPGYGQATPGRGQALPDPWPVAPGLRQATPPVQATIGPRPAIPGPGQATPGPGRARLIVTHDSNTILSYMSLLLSLVLNVMTWNLLAHATVWACGSTGKGRHDAAAYTQSPHLFLIFMDLMSLFTGLVCRRLSRLTGSCLDFSDLVGVSSLLHQIWVVLSIFARFSLALALRSRFWGPVPPYTAYRYDYIYVYIYITLSKPAMR